MKAFGELYTALDETTKTNVKVDAMARYFAAVPPRDAAWAVYFLSGRKPRQVVPVRKLSEWACERAGIADWLFDECYQHVGDMAETISLLLPSSQADTDLPLTDWVEVRLKALRSMTVEEQKTAILSAWDELNGPSRFIWNKLITGSFRVGVSQTLVIRALSQVAKLPTDVVSHRMMGSWDATADFFKTLIAADDGDAALSRPYPFFLAHPLEQEPAALGPIGDWQAEYKWDGIRAQLIRRQGQTFLWSRGEDLVTERYPEIAAMAEGLPDGTVLDGELLPWKDDRVMLFAELQKRIGRKTIGKKLLGDVPVILMAYDLIELDGRNLRETPLAERRLQLERIVSERNDASLQISETLQASNWSMLAALREASRDKRVEGLMLKRRTSPYRVGRVRGDWWKWKLEPFAVDAVLIYAQPGHGKRSGLFTDYTFGVWDHGQLVPFAKAYSGLTDIEIAKVDAFIRANTMEKFGPVRTVKPELVFELGFEGIQRSTRHKSGIAVRFPRMLRWRLDKPASEADTLDQVKALLPMNSSEPLVRKAGEKE